LRAHFYIIIIMICSVSFSAPVNTAAAAAADVEPVRTFVKNRNNDRAMTKQRRVINAFKMTALSCAHLVIKVTKTRFSDVTNHNNNIYHIITCYYYTAVPTRMCMIIWPLARDVQCVCVRIYLYLETYSNWSNIVL